MRPTVDTVIRRAPRPNPPCSDASDPMTPSRFASGSPIPMYTTLEIGLDARRPISSRATRSESRYWATISAALSWRRNPKSPVAQKRHASAQPACDERQSVRRSRVGMSTDSTRSPSSSRHRCFTVPSFERATKSGSIGVSEKTASSASRRPAGRFVISSNERAPRSQTHSSTCRARYAGSPRAAKNAPSRSRPPSPGSASSSARVLSVIPRFPIPASCWRRRKSAIFRSVPHFSDRFRTDSLAPRVLLTKLSPPTERA